MFKNAIYISCSIDYNSYLLPENTYSEGLGYTRAYMNYVAKLSGKSYSQDNF